MADNYLEHLEVIGVEDAAGLIEAHKHYGSSCLNRGGVGLYMMLARKIDRIENRLKQEGNGYKQWDILDAIAMDTRAEGIIDDVRDLRRYLMIVEAEARARGYTSAKTTHRDNAAKVTVETIAEGSVGGYKSKLSEIAAKRTHLDGYIKRKYGIQIKGDEDPYSVLALHWGIPRSEAKYRIYLEAYGSQHKETNEVGFGLEGQKEWAMSKYTGEDEETQPAWK